MSQYSFHGGGGAESEKSFDPDALYGERLSPEILEMRNPNAYIYTDW